MKHETSDTLVTDDQIVGAMSYCLCLGLCNESCLYKYTKSETRCNNFQEKSKEQNFFLVLAN